MVSLFALGWVRSCHGVGSVIFFLLFAFFFSAPGRDPFGSGVDVGPKSDEVQYL